MNANVEISTQKTIDDFYNQVLCAGTQRKKNRSAEMMLRLRSDVHLTDHNIIFSTSSLQRKINKNMENAKFQ